MWKIYIRPSTNYRPIPIISFHNVLKLAQLVKVCVCTIFYIKPSYPLVTWTERLEDGNAFDHGVGIKLATYSGE